MTGRCKIGIWMGAALLTLALNGYAKDKGEKQAKHSLSKLILPTDADSVIAFQSLAGNKASVFIFLSPECPIAQQSTLEIRQLANQFKGCGISFYGVVPGTFYSKDEVKNFSSTYKLHIPLILDKKYSLTHELNAVITPQAFVIDSAYNILYSGAIDNTYRALGKKNAQTTHHYLSDALTAIQANKEVTTKSTTPVGCLVEGTKKRKDD